MTAHRAVRKTRWIGRAALALPVAAIIAVAACPAVADEGMWLPHELDRAPVKQWQKRGLELDAKELYHPKKGGVTDAVVRLGGGTGTFVSPRGLIVTNHHVASGALQRNSTVENNYLEDGFFAASAGDEIPALGYNAYVLQGVENVTERVLAKVKDGMAPAGRYKAIEVAEKEIVKEAEAEGDVFAEVKSIYGGSEYYLYTYFKIKDLRIVYAPPHSIGVYGGDIDNWIWPRHTGDFAFLRAYVGPNGESALHSEDNVPYRPERYLPFSTKPLEEGDFTMIMGYPGKTRRHRSYYAIDYAVSHYYPRAIDRYASLLEIIDDEGAKDADGKIKLAWADQVLNNSYKNNQGMLEGLVDHDLLGRKKAEVERLREFMASKKDVARKYGDVLEKLEERYTGKEDLWDLELTLTWTRYITNAMRSAYTIYNWAVEKEKSDDERDASYMPRDEERLRRGLELADRRFHEPADKRILAYFLTKMAMLGGERPEPIRDVCGDLEGEALEAAIVAFVDELYANTSITDKDARMAMFDEDAETLRARGDKMIEFAAALEAESERIEELRDAFEGAMLELRPRLISLRAAERGAPVYPDANRSMRISVGAIQGYSPRDAVNYHYLTTLSGAVAKHTGEKPFDCPDRLLELHRDRDFGSYADPNSSDVPVCFLSTDDITGGSSGSPVLNGRGEIIGLAFDGNYESISSDYQFLEGLSRCINVDSRYILFVVERFSGATALLEELTVEQHARR